MKHIGADLHSKSITFATLNEKGKVLYVRAKGATSLAQQKVHPTFFDYSLIEPIKSAIQLPHHLVHGTFSHFPCLNHLT